MEIMKKDTSHSHSWWFDSHRESKRSSWLQSTLSELDEKTKAMLKLIEEDADSFAQRAEMYYKKRPELISMVEDFYRAHRSLAEQYDHLKSDHGTRLIASIRSPFLSVKHQPMQLTNLMEQTYDSYSGTSDAEEYPESEVDNPHEDQIDIKEEFDEVDNPHEDQIEIIEKFDEVDNSHEDQIEIKEEFDEVENPKQEDQIEIEEEINEAENPELEAEAKTIVDNKELQEEVVSSKVVSDDEIMKLREEMERLKDENKLQKDFLMQKDEEKREAIRQLSMAVGVLKDENVKLRKYIVRDHPKKYSPFDLSKLKGGFLGKLFGGSAKSQATVRPL